MYRCRLHIVIAAQCPELGDALRETAPLERFEHTITLPQRPGEILSPVRGDVVFLSPAPGLAAQWREKCGRGAKLILCAGAGELGRLNSSDINIYDDIWQTPIDKKLAKLRLKNLFTAIKLEKDLRFTQTCLDTAIDSIPDMIWFKNRDGLHLKVNKAFCQTVGKAREDVIGKDHCYIWNVSHEDYERGKFVCKETDELVLSQKRSVQCDETVKIKNGMRQFKTYKSPLFDDNGDVIGSVGIGRDITDLENMGTEMEILLRSMPYAIIVRNEADKILNANLKFEKFFGSKLDDVLGKEYNAWAALAFGKRSKVNGEGFIESQVLATGLTLEIHEEPIYDVFEQRVGSLSIYRDVTVERELEKQIIHNSHTDFMTGLYNRRCFYQYMHNSRGDRPVSLLSIDLDQFKKVNDTHGHKAGDEALIQTAGLLRKCFSNANEFIARFGGDEFIIAILGQCDKAWLEKRACEMLARMRETFGANEKLCMLTASVGIAQTCDPSLDIDALIQQSDAALYKAKQLGRARCCVYSQNG